MYVLLKAVSRDYISVAATAARGPGDNHAGKQAILFPEMNDVDHVVSQDTQTHRHDLRCTRMEAFQYQEYSTTVLRLRVEHFGRYSMLSQLHCTDEL